MCAGLTLATVPMKANVWRVGNWSEQFLLCRLKDVCIGGNGSATPGVFSYCRKHHTGPLCEVGCGYGFRFSAVGVLMEVQLRLLRRNSCEPSLGWDCWDRRCASKAFR